MASGSSRKAVAAGRPRLPQHRPLRAASCPASPDGCARRRRTDARAPETDDGMADGVAHVADLPVAVFATRTTAAPRPFSASTTWSARPAPAPSAGPPAKCRVTSDPGRRVGHAAHAHFVFALDAVAGTRQTRRKPAAARQHEQSFRVVVEAADRIEDTSLTRPLTRISIMVGRRSASDASRRSLRGWQRRM